MAEIFFRGLPFDTEQLRQVFAQLEKRPPIHVHDVLSGNINTIIKVECEAQLYALRVRTQEQIYRYEPDLVKEACVAELLKSGTRPRTDADRAALFADVLASGCGVLDNAGSILPIFPRLCYYDWTRQILANPYCVYEWVEGVRLWDTPRADLYHLAGRVLAQIHTVQFTDFYADFVSIGKQPLEWAQRFRRALDTEILAACSRLPQALRKSLEMLDFAPTLALTPCLVHNDYTPGNILVHNSVLAAVIDWDNSVIDAPPLDFVKMKYWTAKDDKGQLGYDPALFGVFVDGYGPAGQEIVESLAFALYEVLWLLRVFNFECSKQEQGLGRAPGYPAAAVYEGVLLEVLAKLRQF